MAAVPGFIRIFIARPRMLACVGLGVLSYFILPHLVALHEVTAAIISWNAGALTYLALALWMMFRSSHTRMRQRALDYDEGRLVILALVVVAAMASLAAIVSELAMAKGMGSAERYAHVGLAAATLLTSWAFTQVMFAQHYAHDFYAEQAGGRAGGLEFPGETKPDYGDFLYFSCVIGTSAQTADVSFTTRTMRRTGLLHCVLAFVFNTTLLALMINIASSLF